MVQTPQTRFITVDGKRLETVFYAPALPSGSNDCTLADLSSTSGKSTYGNSQLVMLHEGLGSVAAWKDFPQHVANATSCAVLAYSRHGYGKSERLAEKRGVDFMHHEAQVVLPEILRQSGIENPILFGHSDGASISLIYAGTHPDRGRGLILEAPHVFVEEFGLHSTVAIQKLYAAGDLRPKLARYHDHVDEMFRGWSEIWLAPEFRAWNIEEYVARITCPVLVIQGEKDEYGTIAHVQSIQRSTPKTEALILPACGHSPHRERTGEVLAAISQFVGHA